MVITYTESEKYEAQKILAYFVEGIGSDWKSIRRGIEVAAAHLKIEFSGHRRSQKVVECARAIRQMGIRMPDEYLPPWQRVSVVEKRRAKPQISKFHVFYTTYEWRRLRYQTLKLRGRKCECCGATPVDGAAVHVDHIKSIREYWEMRLDPANLQVLCEDCNAGKGWRDETDWRGQVFTSPEPNSEFQN